MAFAFLNSLAARWQQRGLTHLLIPRGFDAFAQTAAPTEKPRFPAQETRKFSFQKAKNTRPDPKTAEPVRSGAEAPKQGLPPAGHKPEPLLPPQHWPAPWRDLLRTTRPGRVLWTYAGLGLDLTREDTPGRGERRAFLARMLQDLGYPPGTHTFWPVCLPDAPPDGRPDAALPPCPPAPEIFWAAAARLKARAVVVMGESVIEALGLHHSLAPLQHIRHGRHLVWGLWSMDELLSGHTRYKSMLAFIRTALPPAL